MKKLWMLPVFIILLAACNAPTPLPPTAAPPAPTPTPAATFTVLNACDLLPERDASALVGEPVTVFEETPAGQITGEFGFVSRCEYAGFDPASEARLVLLVIQARPGSDTVPIAEIAERYIGGMEQAGVSEYEALTELGEAAFWLPETQTITVFQPDGTGVTVSVGPYREDARDVAYRVIENTLDKLGY